MAVVRLAVREPAAVQGLRRRPGREGAMIPIKIPDYVRDQHIVDQPASEHLAAGAVAS